MTGRRDGIPTLSLDRPPERDDDRGEGAGDGLERALLRGLLLALMTEGRRFAGTPAGRRWRHVLADASLVREGWALWGMAGLDMFLRGADTGPGSPRAMAEDILALLDLDDRAPAAGIVVSVAPSAARGPADA